MPSVPAPRLVLFVLLLAGCQGEPALEPPRGAVPPLLTGSRAATAAATVAAGLEIAGTGQLGSADFGETRAAEFTLRNTTAAPISLALVAKSCACAAVDIHPADVPPGDSATVRLRWEPQFRQVESPDDLVVRLWVELGVAPSGQTMRLEATGVIVPRLMLHLPRGRLDLGRLDLADLKAGKEVVFEVISRTEVLATPPRVTTSHPSLEVTAATSLTADRLAALRARAGWRYGLRVNSGLPVGAWQETLRVHSDLYALPLEATIEGFVVAGAVSLQPDQLDLRTATLSLSKGYRCPPLRVSLRFEEGRTLHLQRVEPSFLKAEVRPLRPGEWEVVVSLPGDNAARAGQTNAQLEELLTFGFDSGVVVLTSDHTQAPRIQIPITGGRLRR